MFAKGQQRGQREDDAIRLVRYPSSLISSGIVKVVGVEERMGETM
jgi:hypothetical protein